MKLKRILSLVLSMSLMLSCGVSLAEEEVIESPLESDTELTIIMDESTDVVSAEALFSAEPAETESADSTGIPAAEASDPAENEILIADDLTPGSQDETPVLPVEPTDEPTETPSEDATEAPATDPTETPTEIPTETPAEEPSAEPTEEPTPEVTEEPVAEPTEEPATEITEDPTQETTQEMTQETTEEPEELPPHQIGDFVSVSTATRAFLGVDNTPDESRVKSDLFVGVFTKDAIVQIEDIAKDDNNEYWYKVRYLYGDSFSNGRLKWTAYGTLCVLASETADTDQKDCTVTDYAYTREQYLLRTTSGRRMLKSFSPSAMNGFTLKNINVTLGSFQEWQSGLNGSSGKDSDYPQIAKSSAHGTIYATPHYLAGFEVYCLEHTQDGPGEGSGSNQAPKGPYVLVDMDTFCNTNAGAGVTGVQFSEKTMHALAWVLRHTYPFMVLDRSDSNNNTWSRVAGQFAMREVIKQLEGSQYVRSYWDMDNFYAFSGGAPAVYLTYARWLAANGISRANITGKITFTNASLAVSGSNYVGTVTVTTDADLIRIPKSVGTLTGNSAGADSSYYYAKSGDTIKVTSTERKFTVTMESISSDSEEAHFLVGVPEVAIQKILVPTYGSPYPLKEGSVTFELKLGEIEVTKKSSDGILLKNTVFELLSGNTVIKTATTNASGIAKFTDLEPGAYTVREKTPPQGYTISATSTASVTVVAGAVAKATFTNNRICGKMRIVKTDSLTNKPLPGATFTVTRLSGPESDNASNIGQVVATITTNAQGIAETGLLPWGEYRIVETGVPDGYLDSGYSVTAWIK